MGSLIGLMIQLENFNLIQKFDEFDDYINKSLSIAPQITSTHNLLVNKYTTQWGEVFDFFPMRRHMKSWNPEGKFLHDPGGRIICQHFKYLEKLFAIYISYTTKLHMRIYIIYQERENWTNYTLKCNIQSF